MPKSTVLFALLLAFAVATAESKTRADCERDYQPRAGQAGKDVIWWPTDDGLVSRMLKMAKVGPSDIVYDLGAGDGRIAITAAKQFGARAIGIEYEAPLVTFGQCLAEAAGVADRVQLRHGDIFASDFSDATVVTMYLLQKLNLRLRPTLLDMKPGTRVISHSFDMGDWEPDDSVGVDFGEAFLWIVPAKVAGTWTFRREGGTDEFTVDLKQAYQRLSGNSGGAPLSQTVLRGSHIEFAFTGTRVVGTVNGDGIEAKVTRQGKTSAYSGTRR
jgi:hypothetical protein